MNKPHIVRNYKQPVQRTRVQKEIVLDEALDPRPIHDINFRGNGSTEQRAAVGDLIIGYDIPISQLKVTEEDITFHHGERFLGKGPDYINRPFVKSLWESLSSNIKDWLFHDPLDEKVGCNPPWASDNPTQAIARVAFVRKLFWNLPVKWLEDVSALAYEWSNLEMATRSALPLETDRIMVDELTDVILYRPGQPVQLWDYKTTGHLLSIHDSVTRVVLVKRSLKVGIEWTFLEKKREDSEWGHRPTKHKADQDGGVGQKFSSSHRNGSDARQQQTDGDNLSARPAGRHGHRGRPQPRTKPGVQSVPNPAGAVSRSKADARNLPERGSAGVSAEAANREPETVQLHDGQFAEWSLPAGR